MKGAREADAIVNASRELLNQGDAVGAEQVLSPVYSQFRTDAPVLHLMGQIKKAQGRLQEAERHFRAAVAHGLSEGPYYNELGVVLQARGANDEAVRMFRAALALAPHMTMVRVNLIRSLMAVGDLAEAERQAQAYVAVSPGPESWTMLSNVQRAQERHGDALASAETALTFAPALRALRYNVATALEKVGRGAEALDGYEKLARQSLDTPELALSLARGLYAAGRKKDAEAAAEQGVERWPGSTTLHGALARMRWLRGEGEGCVSSLEAAIAERPSDMALRLACADALHRGAHPQKAFKVLDEALRLAPDTPALLTAMGVVLDELERPLDGLRALRRVAELTPESRAARRNLLSTLLRAGQPDEALGLARSLAEQEPDEQYLIACMTTAMRMLGDRAYRELCDYERLVRSYDIAPPRGYLTVQSFNADLAALLRAEHQTYAHPLDKHLINGSQTSRNLSAAEEPVLRQFWGAVDDAVRDYIDRLPRDSLPARRRGKSARYTSAWSVRLMDGAHQPNHVHDRGWISTAYYAALLGAERPTNNRSGWLKFGEPNRAPRDCAPEKVVEPREGMLVLFPSYFWHGTFPFEGSERLSMAFDLAPG
ncbi:MAG: putative 2OG-Fe(II) oxygenase [Hyphomonadaceae bacterium]